MIDKKSKVFIAGHNGMVGSAIKRCLEKAEYSKNMISCFDKYKGNDVFKVTRNGLVLSVIRKIKT